jgi:hypothetical protein
MIQKMPPMIVSSSVSGRSSPCGETLRPIRKSGMKACSDSS